MLRVWCEGEGGLGVAVPTAGCACVLLQSGASLLPLSWEWVKCYDELEVVSGAHSCAWSDIIAPACADPSPPPLLTGRACPGADGNWRCRTL